VECKPIILCFEEIYDKFAKRYNFPHCDYIIWNKKEDFLYFVECTSYARKDIWGNVDKRKREIIEIVRKAFGSLLITTAFQEAIRLEYVEDFPDVGKDYRNNRNFVIVADIPGDIGGDAWRVFDEMNEEIRQFIKSFYQNIVFVVYPCKDCDVQQDISLQDQEWINKLI